MFTDGASWWHTLVEEGHAGTGGAESGVAHVSMVGRAPPSSQVSLRSTVAWSGWGWQYRPVGAGTCRPNLEQGQAAHSNCKQG